MFILKKTTTTNNKGKKIKYNNNYKETHTHKLLWCSDITEQPQLKQMVIWSLVIINIVFRVILNILSHGQLNTSLFQ